MRIHRVRIVPLCQGEGERGRGPAPDLAWICFRAWNERGITSSNALRARSRVLSSKGINSAGRSLQGEARDRCEHQGKGGIRVSMEETCGQRPSHYTSLLASLAGVIAFMARKKSSGHSTMRLISISILASES